MVLPLGMDHVKHGANVIEIEMLGLFLVKSLITTIPKEEDNQYDIISEAYMAFFGTIVYWLKFGFEQQKRRSF